MPSPFPGMDPYLEDPAIWRGVHHWLISYLAEALQPQLAPKYVAVIGERLVLEETGRSVYPDLTLFEESSAGRYEAVKVATQECDAPVLVAVPSYPREGYIEIVDPAHDRRVITVIELLSPANKAAGSDSRRQYCQKQEQVLMSRANLMAIDLLRDGLPTVAVLRHFPPALEPFHYIISISRVSRRSEHYEIYPLNLRQRLPRMIVPLAPDDSDVGVDLQAVFDRCYDNGAYAALLDYGRAPRVPLTPDDSQWADALLREKRLQESVP